MRRAGILNGMTARGSRETHSDRGTPFGELLRGFRQSAGLTQEELAARSGLSADAVGALERGLRTRPYPHTVRSLADALGLSEEERAILLAAVPARGGTAATVAGGVTAFEASLPSSPTPLLGRERELREVLGFLGRPDVRLLTLTGIGGVGKTRLAVEVAREATEDFQNGAAFVGLAPLGDPALVLPTIVRALGLREAEGQGPVDALRAYLCEKNLLLVLDNFEHLQEAAPEVAGLVGACPDLAVLATSRAPLRVRGEQEYPVTPLALPPSTRSSTRDDVLEAPSGRLFLERARAVSPGFEITQGNASSVAAICWRLAGLPLALELAAAKARFLEPAALLVRLDEALSTAWARDLPERQRTMRAALDWSYDLLGEPERELFRRLSVFAGGFTLEAAEVIGTVGGDARELLGPLGGLVEQSLVTTEAGQGSGARRYGMLEPVRQYARERLEKCGEAEEIRRRHATYHLALAEAAEAELLGTRQAEWLGRLEREHDNLQAALSWSLGRREAGLALRLGGALGGFWIMLGYLDEGRRWLEAALATGDTPASARAKALFATASIAWQQGEFGRSTTLGEEGMRLFRESGDTPGLAVALRSLGWSALSQDELGRASALFEEAAALQRTLDDKANLARTLGLLGTVAAMQGNHDRAAELHEESRALSREAGDEGGISLSLGQRGFASWLRGDHEQAEALCKDALQLSLRLRAARLAAANLHVLAAAAAQRSSPDRSARLWGAAEALREAAGAVFPPVERRFYEPYLGSVRARLDGEAFGAAWAEGRAMDFDRAVEYALGND